MLSASVASLAAPLALACSAAHAHTARAHCGTAACTLFIFVQPLTTDAHTAESRGSARPSTEAPAIVSALSMSLRLPSVCVTHTRTMSS